MKLPGTLTFLKIEKTLGIWETSATSSLPSPSKSPSVRELTQPGASKSTRGAKESLVMLPAVAVFRYTEIAWEPYPPPATMSSLPSPSMSPMATQPTDAKPG